MGCTISNKSDKSSEELLIESVENTLQFTQINSQLLIDSISLMYPGPQITFKQLKSSLKCLGLYTSESRGFFAHITMKAPISMKKIFCLYILKGKSKLNQKIRFLFKIYAESELRIILKSEAELLVSHILQITLTSIPSFCTVLYPDESAFQIYSSKVCLFANSLLKYFIMKIMKTRLEISYSELIKCFNVDEELSLLLKGSKLRDFCVNVFGKQIKNHNNLGSPKHLKGKSSGKFVDEKGVEDSLEQEVCLSIT